MSSIILSGNSVFSGNMILGFESIVAPAPNAPFNLRITYGLGPSNIAWDYSGADPGSFVLEVNYNNLGYEDFGDYQTFLGSARTNGATELFFFDPLDPSWGGSPPPSRDKMRMRAKTGGIYSDPSNELGSYWYAI